MLLSHHMPLDRGKLGAMHLVPLSRESKKPLAGDDWHNRMSDVPADVAEWIAQGLNVGCPMFENNRVVVDFDGLNHRDGKEVARQFHKQYQRLFGQPPANIVQTPSDGIHFHFEGQSKTRKIVNADGKDIGDIKSSGYCLIPPSRVNGTPYVWIRRGPIQRFPEEMFPVKESEVPQRVIEETDGMRRVTRAKAYGQTITAVSGQKGHNSTFRFCCWMRDIGLTTGEAFAVLVAWNETNCFPQWSVGELNHKVQSAFKEVHQRTV